MYPTISLFIIVKNEERNLGKCLESAKGFVSEIIVVDDFSTDKTIDVARSYGAKVFQRDMVSFKEQKQFALDKCSCEWVLNLDADEVLTDELKNEINERLKNPDADIYFIPIVNIFLGRKMKHSGLAGRFKERLALRAKARYDGGNVHERLVVDGGGEGYLKNPFFHNPYRDIFHYFQKFNHYTTLWAEEAYKNNKKFKFISVFRPPYDFFKIYFINLGFLDGLQGFYWALFSSTYPIVKYAKLWNLYNINKMSQRERNKS